MLELVRLVKIMLEKVKLEETEPEKVKLVKTKLAIPPQLLPNVNPMKVVEIKLEKVMLEEIKLATPPHLAVLLPQQPASSTPLLGQALLSLIHLPKAQAQ